MSVIIQSLGFTASNDLQNFIRDKISVLKSDKIVSSNVTLFKGSETEPENNYCEIKLEIPGNDLFVKKNSEHFEVSVSECIDVLKKIINKSKGKQMDKRQADAAEILDTLYENTEDAYLEEVVKNNL